MDQDWWNARSSSHIRAEIKRAGLNYGQLAKRLRAIGVDETESSIRSKLSRGSFSYSFVLQCMHALGKRELDVAVDGVPAVTGNLVEAPYPRA